MEYPKTKPTNATQMILDDFIKEYSVLVKKQQVTAEEAAADIKTTLENNPMLTGDLPTKKEIEGLIDVKQESEKEFSEAVGEMKQIVKKQSKEEDGIVKEFVKEKANEVAGDNKAIDVMKVGFETIKRKDEADTERGQILKDFRDSHIQQVLGDNTAVEAGWTMWRALTANGEEEENTDKSQHSESQQMLGDVKETLQTTQDASIESTVDQHTQTRQMLGGINNTMTDQYALDMERNDNDEETRKLLGGINDTMTDQYALEQEQNLRALRDKKEPEKEGLSWLQKLLIGFGIGALIGGYIRSILLPFELAVKLLGGSLTWVSTTFNKLFDKLFGRVVRGIKRIGFINRTLIKVGDGATRFVNNILGITTKLGAVGNKIKDNKFIKFITGGFSKLNALAARGLRVIKNSSKLGKGFAIVIKDIGKIFKTLYRVYRRAGKGIKGVAAAFSVVFRLVDKTIFKWVEGIAKYLDTTKFAWAGKVFRNVFKFFGAIRAVFSPALMGAFSGLKAGFKLLGKPLAIIFAIVDFIKGFTSSKETTLLGKIKDGVKAAFIGFIELPVKLVGWVVDKILGLFGVEIEGGSGAAALTVVTEAFDAVWAFITAPFKSVLAFIDGFKESDSDTIFGNVKDGFKAMGTFLIDTITGWRDAVLEQFETFFTFIGDIPDMVMAFLRKNPVAGFLFGDGEEEGESMGGNKLLGIDPVPQQERNEAGKVMVDGEPWTMARSEALKNASAASTTASQAEAAAQLTSELSDLSDALSSATTSYSEEDSNRMKNDLAKALAHQYEEQQKEKEKGGSYFKAAGAAYGGVVAETGLVNVHAGEVIGPFHEVIPQIVNEVNRLGLIDEVDGAMSSRARVSQASVSSGGRIEKLLSTTYNSFINTISGDKGKIDPEKVGADARNIMHSTRQNIQPPADIEALGILFFNKTWGIA